MGFDRLDSKDLAVRMSWLTWVLVRMFGRRLNRELLYPVIGRAYERGVINSQQFHELAKQFDPTQP